MPSAAEQYVNCQYDEKTSSPGGFASYATK